MHFRVLGPLEVDAGDGPIPLGGPKQRAVLASLLVRANQVVPADVLIDDVWGDESPEKARHILQTYVSNLRKALGDGRLQGRPPGYLLIVEPLELDALRFDELVADAKRALPVDPNVAIATLEDALALWRGPALADLEDQASLVAEAARLEELRVQAQEQRIEGLLATGAPGRALGELEPLLARHPLRESLWSLAMLASYRAGRQADALNAYGRARELLADELGIDPSPELVKLHGRILKQDPSLELRGEPLRGYRLLERIGEGPLGVVFRGIQPHVGRDVAVKVVHERIAADPTFALRFEQRAQIAAALEQPHIVPLYDYWREPNRAYLVSRYMRAGSLRAFRDRGGTLDRERALGVVAQLAAALGFAHRQGVTHGAVAPSNVLFDGEGNAYLADFGVGGADPADPRDDVEGLSQLARELLGSGVPPALLDAIDGTATAGEIADVARATLDARIVAPVRAPDERNPYKGLRAFTEADAGDFFGRTELTQRLLTRLSDPVPGARFLAVIGPSGGGKSSVVRAGLVPALRRGGLPTAAQVVVAELFPGSHPLDELEAALVRVAVRPPARLGDLLAEGSRGLLEAVELVVPDGAELVLVVDQFEELFTLTRDEREREHVLELLRVAAVDPASRLRVIVTLRADLYDRPLVYPRFGELLAERNETLPPLTPDELEQAIRRPAERQGMRLESGLVAEMVADVAHQPGGLPLLQYALTELFERRDGDVLTLEAYQEIGGVTGALSARADRLYASADADQRRAIEQVLLRLVTLGEGREDTRRRVPIGELDALDVPEAAVSSMLEVYGHHRLLTFDREPTTREPTVEIAHEALLRAWGRFASWIDHAREDIRQNERLTRAASEWRGSGCDPSFLMSGSRLDQVESWASATGLSIAQRERAFLKASVDQRDLAHAQERTRRDREIGLERRSVRRLRGLVAVFAVAALVAGSLTVVATSQGGRAQREAERADREATISRAERLVGEAIANIDVDPELSILLAMRAVDRMRAADGSAQANAVDALHQAVTASRVVATLPGAGGPIAWIGTGALATRDASAPREVRIREVETGAVVRTFSAGGKVTDLAVSADESVLVATTSDGTLMGWDIATGVPHWRTDGSGPANGVSFSGDGRFVAAAWREQERVRVLDASTGQIVADLRLPDAFDTSLSPSGDAVAVTQGRQVSVLEVDTGRPRFDPLIPTSGNSLEYFAEAVVWSPDGSEIATASVFLDIWDATSGENTFSRAASISSLAWDPASPRLAMGNAEGVRIWSTAPYDVVGDLTLSAMELRGGIARGGVAFSPDGELVAGSSYDGTAVKVWDVGLDGDAEWANFPTFAYYDDVAFTPDGNRVVTADAVGAMVARDIRTGLSGAPIGPRTDFEQAFDLTSDGHTIAFAYAPTITAWDVPSGARLFSYRTPKGNWVNRVDWSPDGRFLAVPHDGPMGVLVVDRTGEVVRTLPGTRWASTARFSPDGRFLAVGRYGHVEIWDWQRSELIRSFPASGWDLAFDSTGTRVVTGVGHRVAQVWDATTGSLVTVLRGHVGDVLSVAFSPDGSTVATGGEDSTVRLFDADTGEELLVLRGHRGTIRGLAFSPDGSKLVSHSPTMVRVWALDVDDLLELASANVTRSLTDEECRRYLDLERCPADASA